MINATYSIAIRDASGGCSTAFTYDSGAKTLTPVNSRCDFVRDTGFWAISINGVYALFYDITGDALRFAEVRQMDKLEYPRVEFQVRRNGMTQTMAAVTIGGVISIPTVQETDTVTGGINVLDSVAFTSGGVLCRAMTEGWPITLPTSLDDENNIVLTDSDGRSIFVTTA